MSSRETWDQWSPKRKLIVVLGALMIVWLVINDTSGGSSRSAEPQRRTTTTAAQLASFGSCHEAKVQFWSSADAKDALEAEGRLTADLQRFHNNRITEAGDYLDARCGGDLSRP